MKVKASVIPFIPAVIAMLFFRVMSVIGVDESGYFLGMDRMVLSYTVIGIALGLFVVCIIINIFDRKTAPVYPLKQNFAAGAFAVMSGLAVMASSVSAFLETTADSEYYMMSIISAAFSIPAGLAFILMSKSHFTGKSTVSGSSSTTVRKRSSSCASFAEGSEAPPDGLPAHAERQPAASSIASTRQIILFACGRVFIPAVLHKTILL